VFNLDIIWSPYQGVGVDRIHQGQRYKGKKIKNKITEENVMEKIPKNKPPGAITNPPPICH